MVSGEEGALVSEVCRDAVRDEDVTLLGEVCRDAVCGEEVRLVADVAFGNSSCAAAARPGWAGKVGAGGQEN